MMRGAAMPALKELLGYGLLIGLIAFVIFTAAEQGGVIGTDLSGRIFRFLHVDF
jgi:hypothetical protein